MNGISFLRKTLWRPLDSTMDRFRNSTSVLVKRIAQSQRPRKWCLDQCFQNSVAFLKRSIFFHYLRRWSMDFFIFTPESFILYTKCMFFFRSCCWSGDRNGGIFLRPGFRSGIYVLQEKWWIICKIRQTSRKPCIWKCFIIIVLFCIKNNF